MRQTGRTTRQIQNAPRGALYVWVNERLHYPRALGRGDLEFVSPASMGHRLTGRRSGDIVIDHAACLTLEQLDLLLTRLDYSDQIERHNGRKEASEAHVLRPADPNARDHTARRPEAAEA